MYCTLSDLIDRFGRDELVQLTDRAAVPTGDIDAAVVERAIGDAGQLIDGYVAGRYRLPLDPLPDLVRRIACDLARFYLHSNDPTEAVKDAHKEALRLLDRIAGGTVTLQAAGIGGTLAAPAGAPTLAAFMPGGDRPMFGRGTDREPSGCRRQGGRP